MNKSRQSLLDEAIKTYLNERSAPGAMGVTEFTKDVKDFVVKNFDESTGDKKGNNLIGMEGVDEDVFKTIVNEVENYVVQKYGEETIDLGPKLVSPRDAPVDENGVRWDNIEGIEVSGDPGSNTHYTMWIIVENSLYYWKFSTSESAGTSLRASDYELAIAAGYNIYKDQNNEENPFLNENGNIDPAADVTEEEVFPYVDRALKETPSDSDIRKAVAAVNTGIGVILRNSSLQNRGDAAVQYGASSVQTASEYTGTDNTPKTDFYFTDGTNISLKKKGTNPQLMSGQVEDAKGIFDAALYYFDENERKEKQKLKEQLVSSFEKDFGKINRPTKQDTVTSIRSEAMENYVNGRAEEVEKKLSDEVEKRISGSEKEKAKIPTLGREDYELNLKNDLTDIAKAHAEAELSYFGIKSQRGSSNEKERLIKPLVIDRKELVARIDNQFGDSKIEKIDEISKDVLKRTLDHRKATNIAKELIEENEDFGKWAVFEAATGLYKFDGPTSSPLSNLSNASTPVADTYLKFDPLPGTKGSDVFKKIDQKWMKNRASDINVRISFKTRSSGFYSTLRLEGEETTTTSFEETIEEERQSMLEDIKNQINIRSKIRSGKLNEDVFGYDIKGAVQNALEKGKTMLGYIADRFQTFIKNVLDKLKNYIDEAIDRGLKNLFDFLGMEVQEVEFSSVEI